MSWAHGAIDTQQRYTAGASALIDHCNYRVLNEGSERMPVPSAFIGPATADVVVTEVDAQRLASDGDHRKEVTTTKVGPANLTSSSLQYSLRMDPSIRLATSPSGGFVVAKTLCSCLYYIGFILRLAIPLDLLLGFRAFISRLSTFLICAS